MSRKRISWSITLGAIAAAVLHLHVPTFSIDAVALVLLGIAIVPWLAPLFKAVELPGGFKVEFADLEETQKKARSAGLLDREPRQKQPQIDDPNLALADVRIKLERQIRKVAEGQGLLDKERSVEELLSDLRDHDVLSPESSAVLTQLLPILDSAVHGAQVDPRASQWAAAIGPSLTASLEVAQHISMRQLLERWESRDGAAGHEVGCELSEFLVVSTKEFLYSMRNNRSAYRDWLNDLPGHTFTIYASRSMLQDELYTAYYERLRERMVAAVSGFRNDPNVRDLALEIGERLEEIEIRAIQ